MYTAYVHSYMYACMHTHIHIAYVSSYTYIHECDIQHTTYMNIRQIDAREGLKKGLHLLQSIQGTQVTPNTYRYVTSRKTNNFFVHTYASKYMHVYMHTGVIARVPMYVYIYIYIYI